MDIIIGAGVSGLSFANFTDNPDYLILEADSRVGGYCKTVKRDGFVWDYSGHFFHFRNPWLEEYLSLNMDVSAILRCSKHTQIMYGNRYVDFPFQKNIHQLEQQEFIDCLYDLFNPPATDASTFKRMLFAKFGVSIAEKFLIPYNEKLYACDLDLLDVDAMGRFFPYAGREDIIRNFRRPDNDSYNSHFTYSRGGAAEYVDSLCARIDPDRIALGERVVSVDLKKRLVTTDRRALRFDRVVSTVPFPKLLDCCSVAYDAAVYSWNKVLVFNLGFDGKGADALNNWVYVPGREFCFYRVGYYDNIFSDARMSLYVELGFDRNARVDIPYWRQRVLDDLEKAGIVTGQKLVASHHVLMDPAYVHITGSSAADVAVQKERLARDDVFSIGRYGSWTYCSIEDNMLEAKALAERLAGRNKSRTI